MVDLETADNVPTAAVVAIGAVVFAGPNRGVTFYAAVDLQSCLSAGLTMSAGTMDWWGRQSAEARAVFDDPQRLGILEALQALHRFVSPLSEPKVWGNGASFDNAILSNAYRACGVPLPWKFWNDRCFRTFKGEHGHIARPGEFKGVKHDAVDDARQQARYLQAIYTELQKYNIKSYKDRQS